MFELVELLTQVNTQILRKMSPLVKDHGISVTELIILWKINKKGLCKSTELTSNMGVPASTLTSLFDRLENKGYLIRIHDKNDRRCILIQGTPELSDMIETLLHKADAELYSLFDSLPPAFLEHLLGDLKTLQSHLQQNTRT